MRFFFTSHYAFTQFGLNVPGTDGKLHEKLFDYEKRGEI